MNLILLDHDELTADGLARLRGSRARHIVDVHRAAVGDTLRVGVVGGLTGEGVVTALSRDEVTLSVRLAEAPPAPAGVDLLLAMPRPKMLRRLLAAVASMGVKRIVIVNSARVEKSYFDSPLLAAASIDEALRLGLSQARDTILPDVAIERRFRPFVEDRADLLWPPSVRRLLAHPAAAADLSEVMEATRGTSEDLHDEMRADDFGQKSPGLVMAIGPEGGWVPFELELLGAHGFQRFSAGPRVLRVDTAVPFLLGQLALLRRRPGA